MLADGARNYATYTPLEAVGSIGRKHPAHFGGGARGGQYPREPSEIIAWLEATARAWNGTDALVWGGARQTRRERAYHDAIHRRVQRLLLPATTGGFRP